MSRIQSSLRPVKTRSYLNRDFDSLRAAMLQYVRTYFPDSIQDFSDSSVGGMFLDLAAYAGDVSAFYLDHQFRELSVDTAVETENIQNLLRMAGVKVVGASPATVDLTLTFVVPSALVGGKYVPDPAITPKVVAGTTFLATNGVSFELDTDLDFNEKRRDGTHVAVIRVLDRDASQNPATFEMTRTATCMSGKFSSETFAVGEFKPFRTISLTNPNVTEITSVRDTEDNIYYEVEALTQDTVFTSTANTTLDRDLVPYLLELTPAPFRYTSSMSLGTGTTTIQFGSGDAMSLDNDIIPDPSEVALPLFGKRQVSRVAIDPSSILKTATLGHSPTSTTITVRYRHGGGLDHNVAAGKVNEFERLVLQFPAGNDSAGTVRVRASASVTNVSEARGGDSAPTIDELKLRIEANRNAQNRIVSAQDLLARVYTMPSSFGRVFRAGVAPSATDPSVTNLYVASRTETGAFAISPDSLKRNLKSYLNQFRLISDNIDILDAQILNYGVNYSITVEYDQNRRSVLQAVNTRLKTLLTSNKFQVGQSISVGDLVSTIINTSGVSSVISVKVVSLSGEVSGRTYSESKFQVDAITRRGTVVCPTGCIFEIKHPDYDIVGAAQ